MTTLHKLCSFWNYMYFVYIMDGFFSTVKMIEFALIGYIDIE